MNGYSSFDVISIDIDGNDWHVWNSLIKHRPRVVIIEFNPRIPNDVSFVQAANFEVSEGCSLLSLIELGKSKEYELICANVLNAIFVVKEEFDKFGIEDNSIDAMYRSYFDGKIFGGWNGRLYTVGLDRCSNSQPIACDALQILPKHLPDVYIHETIKHI